MALNKESVIRIWRWKGYLVQVSVITHITPIAFIGLISVIALLDLLFTGFWN